MSSFLQATRGDTPAVLSEKLGVDRTRTYRGLSPNYSPPPPYEMVWSHKWHEVNLLTELARIYREHGLGPSTEVVDRLDYAGLELEFIHKLAAQEAAAWDAGQTETAHALLVEQQKFFGEHMQQWVPSFVEKALEYAQTDFYRGHLWMLRGFIAEQVETYPILTMSVAV
jgi:TorA maturation chaperone TorD